jgi:hypothetical protein
MNRACSLSFSWASSWIVRFGILLVLSFAALLIVPRTGAEGQLRVDEARTVLSVQMEPAKLQLPIANLSNDTIVAGIKLELLDPSSRVMVNVDAVESIERGNKTLLLTLPLQVSKLNAQELEKLPWFRLRYQLTETKSKAQLAQGIISLSEITPDLFDIRVAGGGVVREGGTYRARIQAIHPITLRPANNVRIHAKLNLLDDGDRSVKLEQFGNTDSLGYVAFEFRIPQNFPQFPHKTHPAGGELHIDAQRGALKVGLTADVQVNQFVSALITTDKSIYQPSQTLHARALLFTPSRRALAKQDLVFEITDPDDTVVFQSRATSSRFGIASVDWPIADNTRLGDYRVFVKFDDAESERLAVQAVRISRYELPNFSVTVTPDRSYYLPGQNAVLKVNADYLFGQPVTRGHVRVVRESNREWNYAEQKWEIDEGEVFEGDTDASGNFVARVDLTSAHEDFEEDDYGKFRDLSYAAYFTDPTSNRTEQRRFDLRVTKNAIHVYAIRLDGNYNYNRNFPITFYVSSFYADGTPAQCNVNVEARSGDEDSKRVIRATVRTNRYGLGKVTGLSIPKSWDDDNIDLKLTARDRSGRQGTNLDDDVDLDDDEAIFVQTNKTLYAAGEPITAAITTNLEDPFVMVDVAVDGRCLKSERVAIHNGHAEISFPYQPEFKDKVTVAAYADFPDERDSISMRTILFPHKRDLKIDLQNTQPSYRPGEAAKINFSVSNADTGSVESALGVVVFDKAVEERVRTDTTFGRPYRSLSDFVGDDEQMSGVTMNDLRRLDMSKPVPSDLQLLAEVLLSQANVYYPEFHEAETYDSNATWLFKSVLNADLSPLRRALTVQYEKTNQYPRDEANLARLLALEGVSLDELRRDPWGQPISFTFGIDRTNDYLALSSAGPDKQFGTDDDLDIDRLNWAYFKQVGQAIDKAIQEYHRRTGGFIRDYNALQNELTTNGISLDQLLDRWGKPYQYSFEVRGHDYYLTVSSSGPNRRIEADRPYSSDDFSLWRSSIDYFSEPRAAISVALDRHLREHKTFPTNETELLAVLKPTGVDLVNLRDPWGNRYYITFRVEKEYADRYSVSSGSQRPELKPVTRVARHVDVRSIGSDAKRGTLDDFTVGSFFGIVSEQSARKGWSPTTFIPAVYTDESGVLQGRVVDASGAAVANATVKISSDSINRETTTDSDGRFVFANLQPGSYELSVDAPGFKKATLSNIVVSSGSVASVDVRVEVGATAETVTVSSSAPTLQTKQSVSALPSVKRPPRSLNLTTKPSQDSFTPRLREYFPETLLWQPELTTDKRGRAQLDFKLADNITTWKMSVIGSTEDGEIGTAETEFRAFQPFFAELDPPHVLTEGDRISLPVVLRNYLDKKQFVNLELKPESWFSILDANKKRSEVPAGDAQKQTFDIQAVATVKDGKSRVTAIGSEFSDAIEKSVTVHPDGEERAETNSGLLGSSTSLNIALPLDTIPNSGRVELKVYPNLMAHVWESVEGIMQRPYGCGEQTISSTYPSLLVLRHLKNEQQSSIAVKARNYLQIGYQRLLSYQTEDGGFGYWGRGNPDVALTAYALRFLHDAADVMTVDRDVIDNASKWLVKQQRPDGSWPANYWDKKEDVRRTAMLTALVARSLVVSQKSSALTLALDYLEGKSAEIDEPYLIASYALAAARAGESARSEKAVKRLFSLAHDGSNGAYWSLETNTPFYGWGTAGRVETSALVLQALARTALAQPQDQEQSRQLQDRGLLFILKNKDRYGCWYSTQATINVLDAMLGMLKPTSTNDSANSNVEIVVNGTRATSLELPGSRQMIAPVTADLSSFVKTGSNVIELRRESGSPVASIQVVSTYYVPWSKTGNAETASTRSGDAESLRLEASFDRTETRVMDEITCRVKAERVGFRGYGMLLAEIGLPPGADVDRASLESAMTGTDWSITQYDVLPDRVVLYLWPRAGGSSFSFKFKPRLAMTAKTASSIVYDYYNPEARAVVQPVRFVVK